jgi:hypothetical protein
VTPKRNSRIGDEDALRYGTSFNVMMFDQVLDQEMQSRSHHTIAVHR